jgi:cold shock CspA family protein
MSQVGIGTIKTFDPKSKRGVIEPREVSFSLSGPGDLYFEADEGEAGRLQVGQLVQFVIAATPTGVLQAKEVSVLSQAS